MLELELFIKAGGGNRYNLVKGIAARARLEEEQQMHSPTALGDKTKPINRAICSMADEMDKAGGQLSDIHVTHPPQYFKRYGAPRWPCLCAHTHDCFVLVCAYARLLCAHTHNYYVRVVMRSHARLLCARYHVRIRTTIMDAKTLIETELCLCSTPPTARKTALRSWHDPTVPFHALGLEVKSISSRRLESSLRLACRSPLIVALVWKDETSVNK
eukprot:492731-Pyramimonas_sp.AAC.1